MRTAVLLVGSAPSLRVWVAETANEQARGLQGLALISESEGMYFPCRMGQASISMLSVYFPIDILFFDSGNRVSQIAHDVRPGDQRVWNALCSGVLEVRGGWCSAYGVRVGDPLVAGL